GSGGTYAASPAGNIGDQIYLGGAGGNSGTSGSGGGGGGAGSSAVGKAAANNTAGGTTATNGGAGGAGGTTTSNGNPGSSAASNFGGGGSGAVTTANGGSQTGGAGRQGLVIVSWSSCPTYALSSLSSNTVCGTGNGATVNLSGTAANLQIGIYTVTYNLTGANTTTAATASMTVTSAGSGSFTSAALNTAGSTTITITQLQSGGANGCTSNISSNNVTTFTVGAIPTASINGTTTGCGSVTLTASGGTTYLWNGGSTNTSATNTFTTSGTYTVTITSSAGCTATASQNVTVNTIPTATVSGATTACGSVTLTASGGNTYSWSGGSATTSAVNTFTASGTYTVTVTSASGCTDTETSNITVNAAPTTSISGATTGCGSVTLTASGSGTFLWNGGNSATNATNTFGVSGNYQVVVTAENGCTASASQLVTISPGPSVVNAGSDVAICSGESTVLNGSSVGALLCNDSTTYSASPGIAIPDNNLTGITSIINVPVSCGSAGEIVSVTLSVSHTYTADLDIYLKSPAGDSIALVLDQGGAGDGFNGAVFRTNGAALSTIPTNAAATGSYIPQQAFANLGSSSTIGNWTLRIVDDAAQDQGTLTSWSIEVKTNASSNSPVTYSWSPATGLNATNIAGPTATPSATTTYTLTATSAGCSVTDQVVVTVNEKPSAPAAGNASRCGSGVVTISATPSPGETIDWYAGATGGSTLSSGSTTYTNPSISFTTVYYAEAINISTGCVSETRTALSAIVNSVPIASISNNNGLALSCAIPSTTLTASGGASYLWNAGATTAGIDVTTAGTFTVTVTGSNGCTATTSASASLNNSPPTAGITNNTGSSELTCSRTSISLTASGGGAYSWDSSLGSSETISISNPGTYSVTVTSGNGCTDTETIEITQNISAPIASISNNNGLALNCIVTSTTLTANGGTSYLWNAGATTAGINVTTAGTLTVTVTGSNGCTATTTESTTLDNKIPTVEIQNNTGTTQLTCNVPSITLTATGGTSYFWSTGSTNSTLTISNQGIYTVIVTGLNGCTASESINLSSNLTAPAATIIPAGSTTICAGSAVGLQASSGSSYLWSSGAQTQTIQVAGGTYTVTITGSNGCTAVSSSTTVTEETQIQANAGTDLIDCDGTFNLSANSPGNLNSNWSVVSGIANISDPASPNSTVIL
ncbi:MAG: beta strand repeat-containing protein, partial [Bacteroidota bacterium]